MISSLRLWARQALLPRLTCMHAAAGLLIAASGLANVRYGLSLAQSEMEKVIAVGASIGADLFSAVGVAAVAYALTDRKWGKAAAASVVLAISLSYAFVAGIGFASQTRSEVVGHRAAAERTDKLLSAELASIDAQIAALPISKPVDQLNASMARILADPKAGGCRSMDGPYTKQFCPAYFELKAELGSATERKRLEQKRSELAVKLQTTDTITNADPLSAAISVYANKLGIIIERDQLLPWLSLMFVFLVVLGGPVALWLAETSVQHVKPDVQLTNAQTQPLHSAATEPTEPETVIEPPVVRQRRVALTPAAGAALKKIKQKGGTVRGKTQSDIALQLGVPRTSFRRVLDRLEQTDFVATSHDDKGYLVRVVH